jgi:hypothetical protein
LLERAAHRRRCVDLQWLPFTEQQQAEHMVEVCVGQQNS